MTCLSNTQMCGTKDGNNQNTESLLQFRKTFTTKRLTVRVLEHDGEEEVPGGHVALPAVLQRGELHEALLSDGQLPRRPSKVTVLLKEKNSQLTFLSVRCPSMAASGMLFQERFQCLGLTAPHLPVPH